LEGFYEKLAASDDSITAGIGNNMLCLLPMLSEFCKPFEVWGLTSLYHLWLLAADDWRSPWLVRITAYPGDEYRISYRMAEVDAPWPDALAEGLASDKLTACQFVLIGMKRSGGWN
jgi:hypothetical protein